MFVPILTVCLGGCQFFCSGVCTERLLAWGGSLHMSVSVYGLTLEDVPVSISLLAIYLIVYT